jgi:hypothetical protein
MTILPTVLTRARLEEIVCTAKRSGKQGGSTTAANYAKIAAVRRGVKFRRVLAGKERFGNICQPPANKPLNTHPALVGKRMIGGFRMQESVRK